MTKIYARPTYSYYYEICAFKSIVEALTKVPVFSPQLLDLFQSIDTSIPQQ